MYTTLHSIFERNTWRGVDYCSAVGQVRTLGECCLRFVFSFALIFAYVGVEVYMFRSALKEDPTFFRVLMIGTTIWIAFLIGITQSQHLSRSRRGEANAIGSPEIKLAIFREACLLAALLIRLSSERAMEKEIPPEIEIITRRNVIDRFCAHAVFSRRRHTCDS